MVRGPMQPHRLEAGPGFQTSMLTLAVLATALEVQNKGILKWDK